MCFSPGASFGAGAVLLAIGLISVRKTEKRSQLPLASVPLIFSVQQFAEGFLWMSLQNEDLSYLSHPMAYVFQFCAHVLWPFWIPFAVMKAEEDEKAKSLLRIFMILGSVVSLYLLYLLFYPIQAKIAGLHIVYERDHPDPLVPYTGILYILATVIPGFISRVRWMWVLGAVLFISYLATAFFYREHVISIWCFFASLLSMVVLYIIKGLSTDPEVLPRAKSIVPSA